MLKSYSAFSPFHVCFESLENAPCFQGRTLYKWKNEEMPTTAKGSRIVSSSKFSWISDIQCT